MKEGNILINSLQMSENEINMDDLNEMQQKPEQAQI